MADSPVTRLWSRFEARDWEGAAAELADDFVAEWPQTGERFRGPANFIAMNRAHPAPNWHISVSRVVAQGDEIAAEVVVTTDEGVDFCLGFYELCEGKIRRATEYWTERAPATTPAWRAEWTERMER